ncbi:hypothetical protein B0H13DRAFT_1522013, partial [Mycena leptocephala]
DETFYWSFDPDGIVRMSQAALEGLALPCVNFRAEACGCWWNQEVYDSIANLQRTKGFDPISPDVAIKLGYPLVDVNG